METKPKTNADRIRNMTDEELAKFLSTGTFICEGLKDICENIPGCEECSLASITGIKNIMKLWKNHKKQRQFFRYEHPDLVREGIVFENE